MGCDVWKTNIDIYSVYGGQVLRKKTALVNALRYWLYFLIGKTVKNVCVNTRASEITVYSIAHSRM